MKKILVFVVFLLLFLPNTAYANGAGLPLFFKINGKYSISNPLQMFGITAQSFLIPQDFTKENYVVNKPIDFEVDESQLVPVIGLVYLKNTKYDWDFGDSSKAEGLKNTHTYSKIGSYILILTINIYIGQEQTPTKFIDSFLLNILPDKSEYTLPQAVITMNNQQIRDPLNNPIDVDFNSPITFDASRSNASSSKIVAYMWNFGDGQTSTEPIATHKYTSAYFNTVVLRVKDANGFISDTFVGLISNPNLHNGVVVSKQSSKNSDLLKYFLIAIGVVAVILVIAVAIKLRRKK